MSIVARYISVSKKELLFYKRESHFLENVVRDVPGSAANELYLGEAWEGITYLLTGQQTKKAKDDLLHIVVSDQYIDETQDFGCGPAHYVESEEAKRLYAKIANWNKKSIKKKFNASKLKVLNVYPNASNSKEALDLLYSDFDRIRHFLKQSVEDNNAIIGLMLPDEPITQKQPEVPNIKFNIFYSSVVYFTKSIFHLPKSYPRATSVAASFAFVFSRFG